MSERIEIRTLTDGGQQPVDVARQVAEFLDGAERTLDLAQYDFDFGQLWQTGDVERTGFVDPRWDNGVRAWFTPGHGEDTSARIAKIIRRARTRIRLCSPLITTGPVLVTLAQVIADGHVDIAGCVDATQVREVIHQWRANNNVSWKLPLLQKVMAGPFTGKNSPPYGDGTVHDFMHAKVCVCDDTVFLG